MMAQSTSSDKINLSRISGTKCFENATGSQISDEARKLELKLSPPNIFCASATALCDFSKLYVTHNNILTLKEVTKDEKTYRLQTIAFSLSHFYLFRDKEEFVFPQITAKRTSANFQRVNDAVVEFIVSKR